MQYNPNMLLIHEPKQLNLLKMRLEDDIQKIKLWMEVHECVCMNMYKTTSQINLEWIKQLCNDA